MRIRFVAPEDGRLDKLVADNTKLSRKKARTLAGRGAIRVDGQPAGHPAHQVSKGAVVEVLSNPPPADAPRLPERYRDAALVVVDKPSGLPAQAGHGGGNLHVQGILSMKNRYVGLHHRLDTPASGLMLLTLDKAANPGIAEAFREGSIDRRYLVVVLGDPGPSGRWDAPIEGQPAVTTFQRLATGEGMSVLEVRLETGRTHQVRLHAVGAGHPVIGDRRHGGAAGRAWPRLALHAWKLGFQHPISKEKMEVEAPIPEDLRELVERVGLSDSRTV